MPKTLCESSTVLSVKERRKMRSFSFDVLEMASATGRRRRVEGAYCHDLAIKLAKQGRVKLVLVGKVFAGYAGSYDSSYVKYSYVVTEVPGAFKA
jgi:hypothetical protein